MATLQRAYDRILETIQPDTGGLIRGGFLDLTRGYGPDYLVKIIDGLGNPGTDTRDLRTWAVSFNDRSSLEMESGTLFRLVWFYHTARGIDRKLIPTKTLVERVKKMNLNPAMVGWPLEKLGTLDGGTSQYQTVAVLMGNNETLTRVPFYLRKTYDWKAEWEEDRPAGRMWKVPRDPTLIAQSEDYIHYLKTGRIRTVPKELGDCDLYCFLRTFGAVDRAWGEKNWPQLAKHESNRFETTEEMLKQIERGESVTSSDHRVVEAGAKLIQARELMAGRVSPSVDAIRSQFLNSDCVAKKWPGFWNALPLFPEAARE